jgi:hypothetical protein
MYIQDVTELTDEQEYALLCEEEHQRMLIDIANDPYYNAERSVVYDPNDILGELPF